MQTIAIIGGTGLNQLSDIQITKRRVMRTPYGEPSGPLTYGEYQGQELIFLPRHGSGHTITPHKINYRANIWALKDLGIEKIISVAAVGGIHADLGPTKLAVPEQIIDYTYDRKNTFYEGGTDKVIHIDFTQPYDQRLRERLIQAGLNTGIDVFAGGTYGATQGPRLETAAEIDRMERDGCDLVGMTGMPEAALARELDMAYACIAVVANYAAGRGGQKEISLSEIRQHLETGMRSLHSLLLALFDQIE